MNEASPPPSQDRTDSLLNTALIVAIFIAFFVSIFVISAPKENEQFTNFFILSENRTADLYPYNINSGQIYPLYIGVGNHEYKNVTYSIEVWNMNTEYDGVTNSTRIIAMDSIETIPLTVANDETAIMPYNLTVMHPGYNRIEFLLFKDGVSAPDMNMTGFERINASYRDLYLRVAVS
jgi:uncharacterized membrane protein